MNNVTAQAVGIQDSNGNYHSGNMNNSSEFDLYHHSVRATDRNTWRAKHNSKDLVKTYLPVGSIDTLGVQV